MNFLINFAIQSGNAVPLYDIHRVSICTAVQFIMKSS